MDNQQSLFAHKRADGIDSISIQTADITTVTSLLERERERKEMPKSDNDAEEMLGEVER